MEKPKHGNRIEQKELNWLKPKVNLGDAIEKIKLNFINQNSIDKAINQLLKEVQPYCKSALPNFSNHTEKKKRNISKWSVQLRKMPWGIKIVKRRY